MEKKNLSFLLGVSVIVLTVIVTIALFFVEIPTNNAEVLYMTVGIIIGTGFTTVINFFFGSSQGSKDKTDIMLNNNSSKN